MRIGSVATETGLPAKAIRYYESVGLIAPPRRHANGYRTYDAREIADLRFLGQARKLGFSLAVMAELLRRHRAGKGQCAAVRDLAMAQAAEAEHRIRELVQLRAVLAELAAACPGGTTDCCNILFALARGGRVSKAEGNDEELYDARGDDCCC